VIEPKVVCHEEVKKPHMLLDSAIPAGGGGHSVIGIPRGADLNSSLHAITARCGSRVDLKGVSLETFMKSVHQKDEHNGSKGVPLPNRGENVEALRETIPGPNTTSGTLKSADDIGNERLRDVEATAGCDNREPLDRVEGFADVVGCEHELEACLGPLAGLEIFAKVKDGLQALPRVAVSEVGTLGTVQKAGVMVENGGEP
jgi:hypothetical protein